MEIIKNPKSYLLKHLGVFLANKRVLKNSFWRFYIAKEGQYPYDNVEKLFEIFRHTEKAYDILLSTSQKRIFFILSNCCKI